MMSCIWMFIYATIYDYECCSAICCFFQTWIEASMSPKQAPTVRAKFSKLWNFPELKKKKEWEKTQWYVNSQKNGSQRMKTNAKFLSSKWRNLCCLFFIFFGEIFCFGISWYITNDTVHGRWPNCWQRWKLIAISFYLEKILRTLPPIV